MSTLPAQTTLLYNTPQSTFQNTKRKTQINKQAINPPNQLRRQPTNQKQLSTPTN